MIAAILKMAREHVAAVSVARKAFRASRCRNCGHVLATNDANCSVCGVRR